MPIDSSSMGACIRQMRREGKPNDQRVAICLDVMRRKGGKGKPPDKEMKNK